MSKVKERPILFNGPMVRAILEGCKTQTRREIKNNPLLNAGFTDEFILLPGNASAFVCPFGVVGDRLWVKETSIIAPKYFNDGKDCNARDEEGVPRIVQYLATNPNRDAANDYHLKVSPSIFMFRWASRITLEITDVRVQRLQEITEEDARAEGYHPKINDSLPDWTAKESFKILWDSLNAKRGLDWDKNPWVWALSFKRVDA